MNDLKTARKIRLIRCENGWLAHDSANAAGGDISSTAPLFVFESTQHLAAELTNLLGVHGAGWKVEGAA